jgi:hypothetical protein
MVVPPLDSLCDGPVTYPGDTKVLIKSSKGRSGPTLNMTKRLGVTDKDLGN